MNSASYKTIVWILTFTVVGYFAYLIIENLKQNVFRLHISWSTEALHVSSAKDGPWVVTHLVRLRNGTNMYAVAQLPTPATIIDSRGERFSTNLIQSLTWINSSGDQVPPPRPGEPMKIFYYVPQESESTEKEP